MRRTVRRLRGGTLPRPSVAGLRRTDLIGVLAHDLDRDVRGLSDLLPRRMTQDAEQARAKANLKPMHRAAREWDPKDRVHWVSDAIARAIRPVQRSRVVAAPKNRDPKKRAHESPSSHSHWYLAPVTCRTGITNPLGSGSSRGQTNKERAIVGFGGPASAGRLQGAANGQARKRRAAPAAGISGGWWPGAL